ncbi:hypothetical protein MHYP_G00077100 [Metynnis hypsauchen]
MPKYDELPGFQASDPLAQQWREKMESYMCVESFMAAPMPSLAELCLKLICSISSLKRDGELCNGPMAALRVTATLMAQQGNSVTPQQVSAQWRKCTTGPTASLAMGRPQPQIVPM